MPSKYFTGNVSQELALLGFLLASPSHGYDLHQRFTADLGHVWHLSQSQAYSILKRLESRGDISSQLMEQEKLPARQVFRITEEGRRRFFEWLESGIGRNARSIRLEFLTRLYFLQFYRQDSMAQVYSAQFAEIETTIVRLASLLEQLPAEQVFNRLSLELRLRQMNLIRSWMADIKTQFSL